MRTLEGILPLVQVNPGIVDNLDFDEIARVIGDSYGAKQSIFKSKKAVKEARDTRKQQEMTQQMANAAQPVSGAVKNMAQAEQILQGTLQ